MKILFKDTIKEISVFASHVFFLYELLWIPIEIIQEEFRWDTCFIELIFDFVICFILSSADFYISHAVFKRRRQSGLMMSKKIFALHVVLVTTVISFLLVPLEELFYHNIFKTKYELDEIYFNIYLLSVIASLVIIQRTLSKANVMIRKKEKLAEEYRTKALISTIQPHFLFNNINLGIGLIRTEPHKAEEFFLLLATIYRRVVETALKKTITLDEELRDLDQYMKLLKIKYGEAITFRSDCNVDDCRAKILAGSLQMAIENIVKHNKLSIEDPLPVKIHSKHDKIIVTNPYRPKSTTWNSTKFGSMLLDNRCTDYCDNKILQYINGHHYVTEIPLL